MNRKSVIIIFSILLIDTVSGHSPNHVRTLCQRKAVLHIKKLCPDMCSTGDMLNIYEYCRMGYSDNQVRYICCPKYARTDLDPS